MKKGLFAILMILGESFLATRNLIVVSALIFGGAAHHLQPTDVPHRGNL